MKEQTRPAPPAGAGRSGEAGFTLVESLAAIVILVFGLIGITNLMIVAASSNAAANQGTAAAAVAAQRLEELKAAPFGSVAAGGDVASDVSGFNRDDSIPGVGVIHTRWALSAIAGNNQLVFVQVRSEATGALAPGRTRAEFTTFRSCTSVALGCPAP